MIGGERWRGPASGRGPRGRVYRRLGQARRSGHVGKTSWTAAMGRGCQTTETPGQPARPVTKRPRDADYNRAMTQERLTPRELAELLKSWALEAGFDRAGVAALEPAAHGEAFVRWLARGDLAGMSYLERRLDARLRPETVLAGACAALCVALQYHPLDGEAAPGGDLWPRVARYARGSDYHDLMGKGLRTLAARIAAAFPGVASRPYVDTGPVLERELAARAGLGAVGKNTNLLHRQGGSWFLLGELFLTLDLAPDAPLADLCGRCTRCLEACPTGALPEPYRLDSRRCISYWTIEHRGDLPPAAARWWATGSSAATSARRSAPGTTSRTPSLTPRSRCRPSAPRSTSWRCCGSTATATSPASAAAR
jgi:epoxyqueuosine reductase